MGIFALFAILMTGIENQQYSLGQTNETTSSNDQTFRSAFDTFVYDSAGYGFYEEKESNVFLLLVIGIIIASNAKVEETITMLLTCKLCNNLGKKYNITVGTPEIDSPSRKSIIVNGSIFDPDNTQMGFIPFDLDWALDDEIIDVMLIDVDTRNTKVDSFDMSESTIVNMEAPMPTDMTIK